MGEASGCSRKEILLIKAHIDPTTIQYEDERDGSNDLNTFSWVLSEQSFQEINFEEEVKALNLRLSLPTSWEVFYTTFANNCPNLNLDEMIRQVLTEDIWRNSMGLT